MSQHFIDDIKIENFKCFENLEINGFKRVNVFGGKNNVGKTALLEAIELLVLSADTPSLGYNIRALLKKRQKAQKLLEVDFFHEGSPRLKINSLLRNIVLEFNVDVAENNRTYAKIEMSLDFNDVMAISMELFVSSGKTSYLLKDTLSDDIFYNHFIESSVIDEKKISILYGAVVDADKEEFLSSSINRLDDNVLSMKIIPFERGVHLKVKLKNRSTLSLLSSLGDGINRYIAMLCAVWANQNAFLFIDEIENGIHFSNYKKLWELIFMASEQANCQVFVTSHSKECIEAFNKVQQERNDDAGRYFELYKSEKKQRIVAAARDAEQLHYSLTHGAAIRGE